MDPVALRWTQMLFLRSCHTMAWRGHRISKLSGEVHRISCDFLLTCRRCPAMQASHHTLCCLSRGSCSVYQPTVYYARFSAIFVDMSCCTMLVLPGEPLARGDSASGCPQTQPQVASMTSGYLSKWCPNGSERRSHSPARFS